MDVQPHDQSRPSFPIAARPRGRAGSRWPSRLRRAISSPACCWGILPGGTAGGHAGAWKNARRLPAGRRRLPGCPRCRVPADGGAICRSAVQRGSGRRGRGGAGRCQQQSARAQGAAARRVLRKLHDIQAERGALGCTWDGSGAPARSRSAAWTSLKGSGHSGNGSLGRCGRWPSHPLRRGAWPSGATSGQDQAEPAQNPSCRQAASSSRSGPTTSTRRCPASNTTLHGRSRVGFSACAPVCRFRSRSDCP